MANKYYNAKITKATTEIIGHIHDISIWLYWESDGVGGVIKVNPKRSWFADKGLDKLGNKEGVMPFYQLFDVFDIDCEDGANIEDIKGKYCRVLLDDNFNVIALCHIINDNRYVEVGDLQ